MGIFTSKIFAGVLAGSVTLGGLGLLYTGTGKLQDAGQFVNNAKDRLVQFESNENSLLSKITGIQTTANATIDAKNQAISDITGKKVQLEKDIEGLNTTIASLNEDISGLQADLATEQGNHAETQASLEAKVAELATATSNLQKANAKITELNGYLNLALQKAKEGDKLVAELEAQVQQANAEADALSAQVEQAKTDSADAQPLTQDEVDAVDTSIHK